VKHSARFPRTIRLFGVIALLSLITSVRAQEAGKPAPDFELPNLKQETVKLSGYQGKVVYLDFWASWCGPCRETFPWMNQLQEKYGKDGLQIVAVNIDTKRPEADKFLAQIAADFTVLFDPKRGVAKTYALKGMPTSFLIDREGNVLSTHLGFQKDRAGELEAHIAKALAATPQNK
jgi:cytochrome c biogenesis protein CcmG, thiol:disulfide interchange protein DsbE